MTTTEQLAGLAEIVNETGNVFQGVTVYLDTDVDLSGHEWVSIGAGNNVEIILEGHLTDKDIL